MKTIDLGRGFAVDVYDDYSELYEKPSDKGWITPLVLYTITDRVDEEDIEMLKELIKNVEPRGNHDDV